MKTRRMILAFVLSIACALTSIPALPASVAYATETTGDVSGNVSGNVSNNGTASGDSTVSDDTTASGDSTVSGDGTVSGGSTVSNNNGEQGTEQPAEPEKYTAETPFVFPSVVGASAKLEAEKSNLINVANSQDQGNNQTYPVAVADKGWASGGKIVNALNKDDKMEIPYQAAEAGIYKVVVHYRSGSSSNKLVWAETNGKIQQGEVSAGASNSNEDKQAEFTITITEAGSGTWVFTGPESKSPQLDYFEITFQSRDEYGAQNPFIFPNEVNKTVTLEAEKGILTDVSNNKDGNGQWPLEVKADTWASGGKFVNSLNKDDKLEIHYQAAVAGTYKVVAKYRSGSPNNKLVWSDTEGNIADGEQVAGSPTNETSVDKTVEFNIQIDKAGSGIWTFTGPENNSPQLDRLDITLTSEKPLFTDFVGDEAAVNNSAGEPLPWGPTPDANQYKYHKDELALFVHFGMNTFTGSEWGSGQESVDRYTLESFDADTLVRTARDAGFKKVIVTAKHHDGFCIWDSEYTEHDIGSTEHKVDVLEIISAACTKYEMDMGLYLSPWDVNNPSYGYYDENRNALCHAEGGPSESDRYAVPNAGYTWADVERLDVLDYNTYYNNQLIEILSNPKYGRDGRFVEVWMDGAKGGGATVQEYDFTRWFNTIQQYEGKGVDGREADCMLFGAKAYTTVHWIGNERGYADTTTWAKVKTDKNNGQIFGTMQSIGSLDTNLSGGYARGYEDGNQWSVPEVDTKITSGWFWWTDRKTPKALKELANIYFSSVGHNAPLLLNVPPNNQGTTDPAILDRLAEFGTNIRQTFDENLVQREGVVIKASSISGNDVKFKPGNVSDNSDDTYWAPEADQNRGQLVIDFGQPVTFDVVSIEETIKLGQRINNYKIEVYKDNTWEQVDSSTTIGAKRLARFAPVTASQVRITVGTTDTQPFISSVGVYKASKGFELASAIPEGLINVDNLDTNTADGNGFTYTDGEWRQQTGNEYINGTNMYATNKTVTLTFTGTKVYLLGTLDPNHGTATVSIDNGPAVTIDTYRTARETGAIIFESGSLEPGQHTLVLTGTNKAIGIEAAAVLPSDGGAVFEIEHTTYTVSENSANQFKISRTGNTSGTASVRVAANPGTAIQGDFDANFNREITFEPGETEKIVTIDTKRNEQVTGDRYFTVELMAPQGGFLGFKDVAVVTIKDSDEAPTPDQPSPDQPPVTGEFTVTFKEENGDQIYEAVTVSANTLLTEVAVPKKAEYAFLGWYTTTGKFDIENTQVTSNLDLVAKWLYVGEVKEEDHPEAIDRLEKEEQDVIQITDKVWAAGVKKLKYTGKKVTQSIRVYDGTKLLTEKKDYTLTYKNNQNAYELGEDGKYSDKAPQLTIKMKGNYKGSKTINFQIEKQNISEAGFVSDDLYFDSKAGKTQKLNPVVTWNGKKLTKNDFTISKESVDLSKITEEPIKVTIEGKGNFEGTKTINVVVGTAKKDIALSKVKVAFKIDGKEVAKAKVAWNVWKEKGCAFDESVIVVTYNKKPLKINSDFKVRDYENNEKAGTATLILEGMGGSEENPEFKFHGQKRITFQINGTAMSSVKVNIPSANAGGYPYRGEAIKLLEETGVTVTSADGKTTLDSQDYSVTYTKNENKGTATATLTGNPAEGYTGTKKVTYKITAANIVKNDISFVSGSDLAPIMKGGAKPQVAVVVNGRTLKEGTDYTVAYAKNKKATTAKEATATIKGKGNYAGGAVLNFAVAAKSIDSEGVAIVAKDVVLKNDKWQQKSFKVYDADGKALKAGTDYTKEATYEKVVKAEDGSVTYEAIGSTLPKAGDEIRLTVKGMGDYKVAGETEATLSTTYRLITKETDISKAKITIAPQAYNGGKVTLAPTKAVFTEATVNGKSLFVGEEASFEILEDTYQKNDKKGTAKVTIRGKGGFGGEKVVSFKIVERNIEDKNNWWASILSNLF